jgi:hypothetical protein
MKEMLERGTTIQQTRDEEATWKKGEEGHKDIKKIKRQKSPP